MEERPVHGGPMVDGAPPVVVEGDESHHGTTTTAPRSRQWWPPASLGDDHPQPPTADPSDASGSGSPEAEDGEAEVEAGRDAEHAEVGDYGNWGWLPAIVADDEPSGGAGRGGRGRGRGRGGGGGGRGPGRGGGRGGRGGGGGRGRGGRGVVASSPYWQGEGFPAPQPKRRPITGWPGWDSLVQVRANRKPTTRPINH